jgi:putative copper resistance protein D
MIVAAVALAIVYLRGVRRLAARGRRWPWSRTIPFLAGTAVVAVAGVLRDTSFVLHMWEHILIGMAAPLLLALGAPVTLALQTAGPGTRRGIRRVLHSRAGAVVAHPVVGWLLFGGTIVVVAFSPVLELAAQHTWFHVALHAHLLLVGALFLWPLVGTDPTPRALPYGARLLAVLVAVPFHAFVGVALLSTTTLIAPEAYPSLADQHRAAGLLWASGELFGVALVGIVFAQWLAADRREAARFDRVADSSQ